MSYVFKYGSGTKGDPFQVWDRDDLNGVRDHLDKYFIQMADVTIPSGWQAIGGIMMSGFLGSYNGNGYKITNNGSEWSPAEPLFNTIRGAVRNLRIVSGWTAPVEDRIDYVGALCRRCEDSASLIENVGVIDTQVVIGDGTAGGLIGAVNDNPTIKNCFFAGRVGSYRPRAGGLIGLVEGAHIENCYSIARVAKGADVTYGEVTGGLYDEIANADVISSYWNTDLLDTEDTAATWADWILDYIGEGLTTEEMAYPYENAYQGWDFENVWFEDVDHEINDGYPYLWSQDMAGMDTIDVNIDGTVTTSKGNINANFPKGSTQGPATITLKEKDSEDPEVLSAFKINAATADGKPIHNFDKPFELNVSYADSGYEDMDIDEEKLRLHYWDTNTKQWEAIPFGEEGYLDTESKELSVILDHLTEFALMEKVKKERFTMKKWQKKIRKDGRHNFKYVKPKQTQQRVYKEIHLTAADPGDYSGEWGGEENDNGNNDD